MSPLPLKRAVDLVLAAATAAALAGCATAEQTPPAQAFAPPTKLTARLVDPINIVLTWQDNATNEAGYFVEYSPDANAQYALIETLPPDSTTYHHAQLLPNTRFVFRVRPFFGRASNVAEFTTGREGPQQNPPDAALPPPAAAEAGVSMRSGATETRAAPSGLVAALIPPAGVRLQWTDNARDEDGFLLELRPPWESDFKAAAFLEPNTTSLDSYGFPFETRFQIRIRAIVYGPPSNLAEKTTGKDPSFDGGAVVK